MCYIDIIDKNKESNKAENLLLTLKNLYPLLWPTRYKFHVAWLVLISGSIPFHAVLPIRENKKIKMKDLISSLCGLVVDQLFDSAAHSSFLKEDIFTYKQYQKFGQVVQIPSN